LLLFCFVDINVAEIEAKANEILGSISAKEDAEIQEHLGGTKDNRLFFSSAFMLVIAWSRLVAA
jgi:hypothetical protein